MRMSTLLETIRHGRQPDSPDLIIRWLESAPDNWESAECQFYVLIEAAQDELVPAHWRRTCLDHIHRPLTRLYRLAETEYQQSCLRCLRYELAITSQYAAASLR